MHVERLHPWNLGVSQAVALQKELAGRLTDRPSVDPDAVRLIAGADVSCTRWSPVLTAGVVVWDRGTGDIVDSAFSRMDAPFPYVPGLLSFREIPALIVALEALRTVPDVLMVDGQGRAHPRRLGIAAHAGLLVGVPTVGVGKSRLCGEAEEPGPQPGDATPLLHRGERIGTVLRSKSRSLPLYVSAGNRITQEDADALVLRCLRGYRLPEPTRLAHEAVNAERRKYEQNN